MSKELTPLKALSELYNYAHSYDDLGIEEADELYELVATPLKALEIIKEKKVDVYGLCLVKTLEEYNKRFSSNIYLEQIEYDLVKEVLK